MPETVIHIPAVPLAEVPFGETQAVLEGDPRMSEFVLDEAEGGPNELGIWQITPGRMSDVEVDEVSVILSGRATIDFEDGRSVQVGPGDLLILRDGERTVWTVHETLRKVYVIPV